MNTTPPKADRHDLAPQGAPIKVTAIHVFGTLEDMSLWHDPLCKGMQLSELCLSIPKTPEYPERECTRVM